MMHVQMGPLKTKRKDNVYLVKTRALLALVLLNVLVVIAQVRRTD
jgi:hypothetical protein